MADANELNSTAAATGDTAPEVSGELTVPATLDQLEAAFEVIQDALFSLRCPAAVVHAIDVAFEELFVNVCRYAYTEQDEPGTCTITYRVTPEPASVTISLKDAGIPFDPLTLKDPTKPANIQEAKIGGLGIFMVKKMMDALSYVHDGTANISTITKSW